MILTFRNDKVQIPPTKSRVQNIKSSGYLFKNNVLNGNSSKHCILSYRQIRICISMTKSVWLDHISKNCWPFWLKIFYQNKFEGVDTFVHLFWVKNNLLYYIHYVDSKSNYSVLKWFLFGTDIIYKKYLLITYSTYVLK